MLTDKNSAGDKHVSTITMDRGTSFPSRRTHRSHSLRGGKSPRHPQVATASVSAASPASKTVAHSKKAHGRRLPRKPTTGPRYALDESCIIVSNGMIGYHDITTTRPELNRASVTIAEAPVYPATWYMVRIDGGDSRLVKVRASNLMTKSGREAYDEDVIGDENMDDGEDEEQVGHVAVASAVEATSPTPPMSVTPEPPNTETRGDAFESFVYANGLDPDAARTKGLLRVAKQEILPGLLALVHNAVPRRFGENQVCVDDEFTILSPSAVELIQRHLAAGRYRTFKSLVSDVRRLFAYAWQLSFSEDDAWRIQVSESWFDSALIVASDTMHNYIVPVPDTMPPPDHWPGSPTQLMATLRLKDSEIHTAEWTRTATAIKQEYGECRGFTHDVMATVPTRTATRESPNSDVGDDAFEMFLYSNKVDRDAIRTKRLLRVASEDILPGLLALVQSSASHAGIDDEAMSVNDEFTILSPQAIENIQRHLAAGRYRTFKALVSDVRRLFAHAWQLSFSEDDAWRIQVAESWFDSALIVASDASERHSTPRHKTAPSPKCTSTHQTAMLSFDCGDRAEECARIVAALSKEH